MTVKLPMQLVSAAFAEGEAIPKKYTCDGENVSPPLEWRNLPAGTKGIALIVDDPDAPSGLFTHWVLFDVAPSEGGLKEGGGITGQCGMNSFKSAAYGGPCPPRGHGRHRYFFTLYALNVHSIGLPHAAPRHDVEDSLRRHTLEKTQLVGTYERES